MIYLSKTADIEKFGHLRGVVVDIIAKLIISQGYPLHTIVNSDKIKPYINAIYSININNVH